MFIIENFLKPFIVKLETVNICNAKCIFCLYKDKIYKKEIINEAFFKRIVVEISEVGTKQLCLTPMLGDPLLDDNLISHILQLSELDNIGYLRLVTNGLAFDRFSDEDLVYIFSALDVIEISIGPNKEVYYQMFGVDRFEHLLFQLERIGGLISLYKITLTAISLSGRACGRDFVVDERLSKLALILCGHSEIEWTRQYMDWGGTTQNLPLETPIVRTNIRGKLVKPCHYSLTAHVYHDGRVGLCACAGADDSLLIGDLRQQSWQQILSSEHRVELILSFLSGAMPDYCARCSFYVPVELFDSSEWEAYLLNKKL